MKKIGLIILFIFTSLFLYAQDISGKWNGVLKIQGTELRLVFNIKKTEKSYTSTMDSPDQGAKDIPVTKTNYENLVLTLEDANLGITYKGKLTEKNIFNGKFQQMGFSTPMKLSKKKIEIQRPQTPPKPYPYYSKEVVFTNEKDSIQLAGTLTLPKKTGKFPAVVLISGSGAQNRDEELLNHKPFLVLSDYLTKKGIAVLRFDDRGTAKSTGKFYSATTFDFATDVECAVKYLRSRKEIATNKIGLIGHSEGGTIAPIIASKDKNIAFIVLMAGSTLRGDQQLLLQKSKIEKTMGIPQTKIDEEQAIFKGAYNLILDKNLTTKELQDKLSKHFKSKYPENYVKDLTTTLTLPWFVNFVRIDPKIYLEKVACPLFAINGSKDLQVSAKENLQVIKNIFQNNRNVTVKELDNLNHLFQECETGLLIEYGTITQTISPIALDEIANWILKQVK